MNAKKIMGAVLVALLAAALFVGAGAADETNMGTVFLYQNLGDDFLGTWSNGAQAVTITAGAKYISNENLPDGKYSNGTAYFYLQKPTGLVIANAMDGTTPVLSIIGGTAVVGDMIKFDVTSALTEYASVSGGNIGLIFTDENNVKTTYFGEKNFAYGETFQEVKVEEDMEGTWKVQAYFKTDATTEGMLSSLTPVKFTYGADVFTFTITSSKVAISATTEEVIKGNVFTVTITGKPNQELYLVTGTAATFVVGQIGVDSTTGKITLANDGKLTVALNATATGELTIKVEDRSVSPVTTEEVIVEVVSGTITAKADADSYYIGNDIELSGTNTVGGSLYFYIEGTNKPFQKINTDAVSTKTDKTWSKTIKGAVIKDLKLDAGTYTIYVSTEGTTAPSGTTLKEHVTGDQATYVTLGVALKQPFISVTEVPEVVVQDSDLKVVGTAEATNKIAYYIFGTNKFVFANDTIKSETISVKDNVFTIKLKIDEDVFAPGQYFMVVQHPMYDGKFNIWADGTNITRAVTENGALGTPKVVFDVTDRQKANAAQALCDELDSQSIDDMYVKLSFIVAQGTSTINPIPAEITKGSKLTVSGTTNGGEGTLVTVEMLSTAFAAVPKETVGSASFISIVTKTDKDGNWEVTFDTTGLNVDEYTVSAAVDGFGATTAKVNVIEGAPTEQPTTTPTTTPTQEQPTETTTPETPGFGALAALAGLGAVAVLLLRRE